MPNPFNISFEIPPLPKLGFGVPEMSQDMSGGVTDFQTKDFNFFTYLQSKQHMTKQASKSPVHKKVTNGSSPLRKRLQSSPSASVRPSLSCNNKR